jgi:hypothetical protein
LNIPAGLWLIIAPFVLDFWHMTLPTATSILFGVFIAVIAALHVFRMPLASWTPWANVILRIALFFAPFYVNDGYAGNSFRAYVQPPVVNVNSLALWNSMISGAIVTVLGIISALDERAKTP